MAAMDDVDGEETILYDLTVQAEWRQDPEPVSRYAKDKASSYNRATAEQSSAWNLLRTFGSSVSPSNASDLPTGLLRLVNAQLNWKFALTQNGELLAILQENSIEIRTSQNEFTTLQSKWNLPSRDPYPQWRTLAWSMDGSMLAISDSAGQIDIFDAMGTSLCRIPPKRSVTTPDFSHSLCSLIFKEFKAVDATDNQQWFIELLAVNYQGSLSAYLISVEFHFRLSHTFDFTDVYPNGVSSVVFHGQHSLLLVGGSASSSLAEGGATEADSTALSHGISAWRVLSGLPYYKHISDHDTDMKDDVSKRHLVQRFRSRFFSWTRETSSPDGIFKLSLSASGQLLASVHYSGALSLWDVPSLRLRKIWPLELQPEYDAVNDEVAENPKLRKRLKEHLHAFYLSDVGWWSDKAVILARGNGAVIVSSVLSLENLLGSSPEWFEPGPIVTWASEGSFLGIECESKFSFPKRHLVSESGSTSQEEEYEEDSDDEIDTTIGLRVSRYVRQGLYYVTDSERFQPPRKKVKLVTRTYRLICLKSTTPEELYARKIDNEEYGEALSLAQSYQLDSDLVYQRQWRKSPVSVAAIQDYLSKIGKRSWVLHECLERVPENFDAMNELLKYGLRGTDLEALVTIGRKEDNGRFILCQVDCDVYHSLDAVNDDSAIEARENEERKKREWLNEVDFNNLSLEQQELCRIRLKLLYYTDRLMTYQAILGGIHVSAEKYDHKFFEKFRSQNIVELAVDYARASDVTALTYLFTYHAKETSPHRLAVLSNFPETFPPAEFSDLLPEASLSGGDPEVVPWFQESWREPDWCEQHVTLPSLLAKSVNEDFVDLLYEEQPYCVRFRNAELSRQSLADWYEFRACEIESLSGQVDNALKLVQMAMQRNVEGLDDLLDDLLTMETFVYECHVDDSITFSNLRQMSAIDKLRLMMSRTSEEMYLKNLRKWVIPFLGKCDQKSPGCFPLLLREYLVAMAAYDLTLCALVFKASKAADVVIDPIIDDHSQLMTIALDCVYAYTGNDQLDKSFEILECLPQRSDKNHSDEILKLHDAVDDLENHLEAARILQKNGLPQSISFIRDTQSNIEEVTKLFTRIARTAARLQPPIGERKLRALLAELCQLQDKVYNCITRSTCYEIFVESLLCSGCDENIKIAGRIIEHSRVAHLHPQPSQMGELRTDTGLECKVAYEQSVQLVLAAAREYFDSSATLSDADMELARTCLSLIVDENPQIGQERDLIEAVSMLEGFSVSILPVQVRMCSDKLQLVQKALAARPSAYKKSQKLLKLGKLLRVGGITEVETRGQVLRLVAEAALKNNDYKSSYEACIQLMEVGYPGAWRECQNLAEVEEFPDIQAKSDLLSFAVVHCTPDMIEPILRAKNLLQTQLLYEQIHARIGDRESPASPLFSHKGALAQTKDILRSTNKATQSVLLHISDSRWWKKTLTSLRPARRDLHTDDYDGLNSGFQKQSCHPFYESVFDKCYTNKSEADYVGMRPPRTDVAGLTISEGLLRTAKLEETVTEGENINLASEVLLQVAEDVIIQDSTLGLAYLLALPNATDADTCFGKVPSTKISLQLAVYYYALQIASRLTSKSQSKLNDFYLCPPHELSGKVLGYVSAVMEQKKESDWSADVQQMALRMIHFNEVLLDYTQALTLNGLDRGVDISRFVQDDSYKKETILGMVLCLDDEVFKIAVSLATRHRVPVRDVYMAHLEFLFEENSLSTGQIENRIQTLEILPELTKDEQTFFERMQSNVYPLISGTDHDRLVLFYSLLSGCSLSRITNQLTPQTHVKLLKKIKSTAPGLDYRGLTSSRADPLDVLAPVLNQDNVAAIAKLASNLNDKNGKPLMASSIYRLWACKLFWEGQQGKKAPDNPSDWIHRYELCNECISKMRSDDFFTFIHNITFTSEAVTRLPLDCRRQVLRRTLKHAKQQQNLKKPKDTLQGDVGLSWEEVISHVQKFLEHIDRLSCSFLQDARNSSDFVLQNYALLFDLTCSQPSKVEDLLVRMVLDGQSLETVEEMRNITSKITEFKLASIVEKALYLITEAMKNPTERHESLIGCDLSQAMERIVSCTAAHQKTGGNLIRMNDIVNVLLVFCADTNVAAEVRLNILQILSQTLDLGPDDRSLVLFYQTQAKVSLIGNNQEVTEAIKSDDGRQVLFDRLLSSCDRIDQLKIITELLVDIWPELQSAKEHADDPSRNVWCQLVNRFLQRVEDRDKTTQEILHLTSSLYDRQSFSSTCASYVFDRLLSDDPVQMVAAAKSILLSRHSDLYSKAVDVLQKLMESCEDVELFTLILKRHLITAVISTAFYPQLVEHVLCSQCTDNSQTPDYVRLESIAKEMQDAGYQAEAGTLVMQFRSTHRSLRTFDAAFSILSRLFHR